MSFSGSSGEAGSQFKSFVSEAQLEERRKKRQEEWEKVRRDDQPLEAPEEQYDPRSLHERLQEQKDKRQAEYEETHRLKNLIKGLDDDEVAFLELVDKTKIEMESKILREEVHELQEYRKAVSNLSEAAADSKINEMRKKVLQQPNPSKKSQQSLLSGALKRKLSDSSPSEEKKSKTSDTSSPQEESNEEANCDHGYDDSVIISQGTGSLQCYGILPGLGVYTDSSDSDNSSNSDTEKDCDYDLIGRRRGIIQQCHQHT